ncbi:MAG: ion transporter [Bacteroidales bacterium]|nr:ion transporter [Bacteroidales bacterium]
MRKIICNFFLNDKLILIFIVINAGIIFLQESGYSPSWLLYTDIVITFIFLVEMIVKHLSFGFKNYWKDAWNRLDGVLVIISLPSLFEIFFTTGLNLSFVLALRVFRVFKFFRIIRFLPNIKELSKGLKKALKDSYAVFLSFIIIIFIFALLNCSLFAKSAPEYFATPLDSIYSIFKLFTIEGWFEIPEVIADYYSDAPFVVHIVKLYFSLLLIVGGVIGLSLINSVFVDAMVSDNNDELNKEVADLHKKIDSLTEKIDELKLKNK